MFSDRAYAFHFNNLSAQGGSSQQGYLLNSVKITYPYYYGRNYDRILNGPDDEWWFNGFRNNWGWTPTNGWTTILASDWTTRVFGTTSAKTSHVLGGRFNGIDNHRITWKQKGTAHVNYAFTDGSVKDFSFPVFNFRDTASMGHNTEGGAETIITPKEWMKTGPVPYP